MFIFEFNFFQAGRIFYGVHFRTEKKIRRNFIRFSTYDLDNVIQLVESDKRLENDYTRITFVKV